jgi:hypothetical protein
MEVVPVFKDLSTVALLLMIVFLLVVNFSVAAHKYLGTESLRTRDDPVMVPDHQVSWAAYEELEKEGQVDYYRFEAKKGEEIYASLIIPQIERLSDFEPELALIGPGLPEGTDSEVDENEVFFEPFTQTSYWERQVIRRKAPEDGTYFVSVWDAEKGTGKYTLAIGEREDFGPGDILDYPSVWWKVRIFAEREVSTYLITGAVLTGLAAGSIWLFSSLL